MRGVRLHHVLIPLFATLAVLPLLIHGCSCGHDLSFHIQSWLEAAQQLRHGTLYPHWAYAPAWQAGEPRFMFYPPLSWMLGELLVLLFPINATPIIFTWLVFVAAGFSMHRLAREFATESASLVAAGIYLANPYMLFNGFERGAYAELMASIWIPLIFLAVLRERPTIHGLAIPLSLVWLTNAPAGVMASYTILLLALVRLAVEHFSFKTSPQQLLRLIKTFTAGIILGLTLIGFYLVPAAYEQRFVQVDLVIMENLRYQDNFLFSRTHYEAHNVVTRTISLQAVTLLAATVIILASAILWRRQQQEVGTPKQQGRTFIALCVLTAVIAFLLIPPSAFIWEHLPNLKFMQFPWRLLTILTVVLSLGLAMALRNIQQQRWLWVPAVVAVVAISQIGSHLYRQGCERTDYPSYVKATFESGHGVIATDEYTPQGADNDADRTNNPGYWLAQEGPNTYAPGTLENPNAVLENYDGQVPFAQTAAARAPQHLTLTAPQPETLVLNLRDFPAWQVVRDGAETLRHIQRDDGLIAVPIPAGASTIDVRWHRLPDQNIGTALSVCGLIGLGLTLRRSRKIKT